MLLGGKNIGILSLPHNHKVPSSIPHVVVVGEGSDAATEGFNATAEWVNGGVAEGVNGGVAEGVNGGVAEGVNGDVAEWVNGGVAEWVNGGVAEGVNGGVAGVTADVAEGVTADVAGVTVITEGVCCNLFITFLIII